MKMNQDDNPWETPPSWAAQPATVWPEPAMTPEGKRIDCGRCNGHIEDGETMWHLQWNCTAQEAWIEAAINDRQYRPDRYRQAKKDLGAKTLKEAHALLAAMKAGK